MDSAGHDRSFDDALVQAVNEMSASIPDLCVKTNSISDTGRSFSTTLGAGNVYGS